METIVVTSENAAEFYAEKMGSSSAPAPAEAEKSEPVVETTSEDDPVEQHDEAQQEEQKPVKSKVDQRIDVLTKQREDARREAAREREAREVSDAKARELEAKLNPPKEVQADAKPSPSQFTDAFEYAEKLAEWSAENALRNRDKQELERKQTQERELVVKTWNTRQNTAKVELPDYEETIASSAVAVSDQVRDAILESDIGPQILYHLAKNPEIAEELKSKSTASALREIGRLEATLSGTKPTPVKPVETPSGASPPITPIRATKVGSLPLDSSGEFTGTYEEYKALRKAGKI